MTSNFEDCGYTDFNMWVPFGCKIASRKRKHCVEEINLIMLL